MWTKSGTVLALRRVSHSRSHWVPPSDWVAVPEAHNLTWSMDSGAQCTGTPWTRLLGATLMTHWQRGTPGHPEPGSLPLQEKLSTRWAL